MLIFRRVSAAAAILSISNAAWSILCGGAHLDRLVASWARVLTQWRLWQDNKHVGQLGATLATTTTSASHVQTGQGERVGGGAVATRVCLIEIDAYCVWFLRARICL